jgi:hypothetical protein
MSNRLVEVRRGKTPFGQKFEYALLSFSVLSRHIAAFERAPFYC